MRLTLAVLALATLSSAQIYAGQRPAVAAPAWGAGRPVLESAPFARPAWGAPTVIEEPWRPTVAPVLEGPAWNYGRPAWGGPWNQPLIILEEDETKTDDSKKEAPVKKAEEPAKKTRPVKLTPTKVDSDKSRMLRGGNGMRLGRFGR